MKRFSILVSLLFLFLVRGISVQAQTISPTDNHTAREEQEGKEIWGKLQSKQLECKNLTDDNYAALGEYFMGQSIGNTERHAAMNQMMISMMARLPAPERSDGGQGEEGEKQMHIVMGKRLSNCDTSAQIPSGGIGFMPMMFLLRQGYGGQGMMGTDWNNMMGGWGGFGVLGWLSMLLFWILLILGVIALIRYLGGSGKKSDEGKSPLDILKERYARGEIGKKEFEEIKKDLR